MITVLCIVLYPECICATLHMIETNMKSYFGKKDLLHSKTSALSSRSSSSPMSRSNSTDKYLGAYKLGVHLCVLHQLLMSRSNSTDKYLGVYKLGVHLYMLHQSVMSLSNSTDKYLGAYKLRVH